MYRIQGQQAADMRLKLTLCVLGVIVGVSSAYPMEFQKPAESEEAAFVEEAVGGPEASGVGEPEAEEQPMSQRHSKQLYLAYPPAPVRQHLLLDRHQQQQDPFRSIGGASSSSVAAQQRWFFNRNQLIDGIINALELLRGRNQQQQQQQGNAAYPQPSDSSSVSNSNRRAHLAPDSVNKAITIVGSVECKSSAICGCYLFNARRSLVELRHGSTGTASGTPWPHAEGESAGSTQLELSGVQNSEKLDLELGNILNPLENNGGVGHVQNINGAQIITNVPANDPYESQVILGNLAPYRPTNALQGLSSFSNNLPQLQLPSVSQSLQSLGNILRLPLRVVNGWLVQQN
ncbi:unnamed protein product [Notodromas monacha]|uniref:Uncharacterized protein n=1 Tax=Notodromas monacha TaxID=399045 RepID=A0A7R9BTD5_9CRUS|nr:unnamed protein product [Notodromas monacha]CAG0921056.1 unnamed protein product [Notodromas monacha]